MRRLIRPRSLSTRPAISPAMSASSIVCRGFCPALGFHQLSPAAIEAAVIALAVAMVAGPGAERLVKALVPKAHLVIQSLAPGDRAAGGLGAALPIVHIVLLEGARRTEHPHPGHPDRLLDMRRRRLVGIAPCPDLGLVGAARMPDPEGARGRPKQREIRKDRAGDRLDHAETRPQPLRHFGRDLLFIGE